MRPARAAAALAGLLLATEALLAAASLARPPVVFDVGPSTGAYHSGFTDSEERPPTTLRWTKDHAVVEPPLVAAAGEGTLTIRHQGFLRGPVWTHVLLSGRRVASFPAYAGPFRVVRLRVAIPEGPLRIDLLPEGPPDPGIAVDWIRLDGGFRLPLAVWAPRALVAGIFVLALLAGFSLAGALTAAGTLAVAETVWAACDPFALAHVATRLAVPAFALGALAALLCRRRPRGRFVLLLFLASYLLKGAALFHPSYFYNDVRNNRRYVQALGGREGTLLERARRAQIQIGVAYPRVVGGKKYAFPYSPVFFLPFTLLAPQPLVIDEAMKQVVVTLAAAEVLLVFFLAGLVFGPGAGLAAALIAACLPVLTSRLLLALWATLGGHFLDTLMIGAALLMTVRPQSRAAFAGFALAAQASLLTYVASLFNVGLFSALLALGERRARILAACAIAVAVTVALLYRGFFATFVTEILPAALASRSTGGAVGLLDNALGALDRVRIFYGFGYPALAAAGFVLLRRRASPAATRVMSAYALAFLGLVLLRSLPGGLFKDLKEMEFVAPLVAVTAGASLEELAGRGRAGRLAAVLIAVGLVAFGLARHRDYVSAWTALAEA